MHVERLIILGVLFTLLSYITIFILMRSPLLKYFADTPDARKVHQIQISRLGGIGIIFSYLSLLAVIYFGFPQWQDHSLFQLDVAQAIIYASIIILILGFLDDSIFVELNVPVKFLGQFAVAIGVVYYFGVAVDELHFLGKYYYLGEMGKFLSVFWIVGVMNAYNIIDGIDGLSASITLITIFVASFVFYLSGMSDLLYVTIPLGAVITGFLIHNYPPATLFAGDTGSLFFGAIAAITSVKIGASIKGGGANEIQESLTAIFIVAFPVLEVGVSMIRRYSYKDSDDNNKAVGDRLKNMVRPDNLHMHHRLLFKGLDHEQALRFLVFFAAAIASGSVIFTLSENSVTKIISLVYIVFLIISVLRKLEYGKKWVISESYKSSKALIALTGYSEYFEHSLRFIADKNYWVTGFNNPEDLNGKDAKIIIVYGDKKSSIENEIPLLENIKKLHTVPIIYIANSTDNYSDIYSMNNVFVVYRPIDISLLMHDIKILVEAGIDITPQTISKTLSIVKGE